MRLTRFLGRLPNRLPLRSKGRAGAGPAVEIEPEDQVVVDLLTRYAARLTVEAGALSSVRSAVLTAAAAPPRTRVARQRTASPRSALFGLAATAAALAICFVGLNAALTKPSEPVTPGSQGSEIIETIPPTATELIEQELSLAELELGDMTGAAALQDWGAVTDAANAYTTVLLKMSVPDNQQARDSMRLRLNAQLARLEGMRADAPPTAAQALDKAIARVQVLLAEADRKDQAAASETPKPTRTPKPTKEHPTPDKSK